MTSQRPIRPRLARDGQQWFFDWMIQESGKVFHFQTDGRGSLPRSVRRHAMVSKQDGLLARRLESLGHEEREAGHDVTALSRYFDASVLYASAQHTIFENNDEKRLLHGASLRCYERVRELAPYRIEHVDIEWNGTKVSGNLHLCPDKEPAPCIFHVPGCDQTKEMYPHPLYNHALQRGMHIFSFDGPGQGESNLRGIKLTADNYESAGEAVVDYLSARPEIDASAIAVYGLSFGSFWALRIAAAERRVKAAVGAWASFCDKYHLMDEESPRYKQLFSYLTGAASETELDRIVSGMTMDGHAPRITCPTLTMVGEYDPRSPLDEVYSVFDAMTCPAELWVFADQHHKASLTKPNAEGSTSLADVHELAIDWLKDRLSGKPLASHKQVAYLEPGRAGPYSSTVSRHRHWYEFQ